MKDLSNRTSNILAAVLLTIMFCLAFLSMRGISTTMDELAHIPAGYSYLTQKDYRLNPEHPPLIKDLSAIPLLFLHLNFPKNSLYWIAGVNNQWKFGIKFLYYSGNNPDQIIFWARIPMIIVLISLGWLIFYWTKNEFNNKTALLALTFFCFSPTFIAHGRLVTTDVGASFGAVATTYSWLRFLRAPTRINITFAGLIFGIAMLLKFSMVILIPFLTIITIIYTLVLKNNPKSTMRYIGLSILIGVISIIFVVWPIYQFHIINYPATKQLSDTKYILQSNRYTHLKNICIWMTGNSFLRAPSYFFLGVLMDMQRIYSGSISYFMGMISSSGWWYYFPIVYLLKVPLAIHVLTIITILFLAATIKRPFWQEPKERTKNWISKHFVEFSAIIFLIIYLSIIMRSHLTIGIRHILPVFPFVYILVSRCIITSIEKIKEYHHRKLEITIKGIVLILVGWYILSSLSTFPNYLSYFNELAGGQKNGYKYIVDSNYDWGQDLKRLTQFVKNPPKKVKIKKIYVDYFGGGDPNYYLKDKYIPYNPTKSKNKPKGWFAVSVNRLQAGRGDPVQSFSQPTGYYKWLDQYHPVTRAGNSIFIYYISPNKKNLLRH